MEVFIRHKDVLLQSSAAQTSSAKAFASLLQVTANAAIHYSKKAKSVLREAPRSLIMLNFVDGASHTKSGEFEELFGRLVESYYHETSVSSIAMWSVSIDELNSSGGSNTLPLCESS